MKYSALFFVLFFTLSAQAVFDAYRAQKSYQAGDVAAAKHTYQKMVVDDYQDWRALYNLGTIAVNEKQYDEAVNDFEKVVALQPENKQAQERLELARKLRDQEKQEQEKQQQEKDKQAQEDKEQQENQDQQDQQGQENQDKQQDDQKSSDEQQQEKSSQDESQQDRKKERDKKPEKKSDAQEKQKKETEQEKDKKNAQAEQGQKKREQKQKEAEKGASAQQKEDKRFSKRENYVLRELDKIDQQIQKEMVRYAVSHAEQGAEQNVGRKNW